MTEKASDQVRHYEPVRVRKTELIRPSDKRREFTTREAQRRLQEKERPRWALVAYGVFLVALLTIGGIAYTSYAFSKYRGEILPGVKVDTLAVGELTPGQARQGLTNVLYNKSFAPVRIIFPPLHASWAPTHSEIGFRPDVSATVHAAEQVGRSESFFVQLLDRLPLHPEHTIQLIFRPNDVQLQRYIQRAIVADKRITHVAYNAGLRLNAHSNHVDLMRSQPGQSVDIGRTVNSVDSALGALTTQTVSLPVNHISPPINDAYALSIRARVENFLSHPPIIAIGKRVIATDRATFAPMFSFNDEVGKGHALIVVHVNQTRLQQYIAQFATQVDRAAKNAKLRFAGRSIQVVSPRHLGRTLDQTTAFARLSRVVGALKPGARIRFRITTTQPSIDLANPASLGINTLLGIGVTSFNGGPSARLNDINAIALRLNEDLLTPGQDVSFNTLVGTGWVPAVYADGERQVNGQLVPARGGGMQQVASTFLRAMFAAGLQVTEHHNHPYLLDWYQHPVGLDAVVSPDGIRDLRFRNNTGKYILIEAVVQPIRQELYIYVYGPRLKWRVQVDTLGQITKTYHHGPAIVKQDSTLADGEVRQTAWAHDGADTDVTRTITYPNGNVTVDHIYGHYRPWRAIKIIGKPAVTPTPTTQTKSSKHQHATPSPVPSPIPSTGPVPTPTFNH